jgi:drug/metabolite transporter (DMT)-like permease
VAEGRDLGHPPKQEQQRWPGAVWAMGSAVAVVVVAAATRALVRGLTPEWAGTATLLAVLALTAAAVAVAVVLRGRTATPAESEMTV